MVVTAQQAMLNKQGVIAYVGANASRFGLDPAAVLSVANTEGLGTTPGSTWVLPKENGFNFGPPSWFSGGAGADIVKAQGNQAAYWSWTPAGLDYWLQSVSNAGASGLTGYAAISKIVTNFERPAAQNVQGNINKAIGAYASFQRQVLAGPGDGNTIVPNPPDTPGNITLPGQTQPGQLPTPTNPTDTSTTTGAKFSFHLFDTPLGPINFTLPWDFSGILLFLAAIFAIIIGALLWKPSRDAATNVVVAGAMA
jgi:hypothetical protein